LSSQNRHPLRPPYADEDDVGGRDGPPLIICDKCNMERVIELQSKNDTNPGSIFFKCLRNNPWVSICSVGCSHRLDLIFLSASVFFISLDFVHVRPICTFYEWQRDYLKLLMKMGRFVIHQPRQADSPDSHARVGENEEADSVGAF
jgi:hypothetical protein